MSNYRVNDDKEFVSESLITTSTLENNFFIKRGSNSNYLIICVGGFRDFEYAFQTSLSYPGGVQYGFKTGQPFTIINDGNNDLTVGICRPVRNTETEDEYTVTRSVIYSYNGKGSLTFSNIPNTSYSTGNVSIPSSGFIQFKVIPGGSAFVIIL